MESQGVSKVAGKGDGAARVCSLLGSFSYRLDPKRRITLPAVFRNRMGSPSLVYVTPDLNGRKCLEIFQPEAFELRIGKLNAAALTDRAASDFITLIGRVSETLDVDVQGRVRIGDTLLARIGVVRDVVIIGAVNRLQVWAAGNEPGFDDAFARVAAAARAIEF